MSTDRHVDRSIIQSQVQEALAPLATLTVDERREVADAVLQGLLGNRFTTACQRCMSVQPLPTTTLETAATARRTTAAALTWHLRQNVGDDAPARWHALKARLADADLDHFARVVIALLYEQPAGAAASKATRMLSLDTPTLREQHSEALDAIYSALTGVSIPVSP